MPETTTRVTQIGRVMIPVTDQDRAIEWYTRTLGFELRSDTPYADGLRWIELAPPGAVTAIAVVLPMEGWSTGVMTNIALSTGDVRAAHADLQAAGVDVDDLMEGD